MQLLRSMLFTALFFVITAIYAVVVLCLCWLPTFKLYRVAHSWGSVNLWLLQALCGLSYRVVGRENLPSGAHVAMWKHSSSWETIAQAVIFPPQAWVLKRELMWIPLVGWAVYFLKPIAIDRGAGTAAVNQVVARGKLRLAQGLWILIFPEGTRVAAGESKKYGVSGALLASRAGCKVIPVAHNAGTFWPRRGWIKKPGVIEVRIGPPIEAKGRNPRAINEDVRAWIDTELKSLP
ncbi:MAG: 1-acyl-sn-glycerol-3-phosphate acyltransferase [Candidatus Obscuribacterales bacterium]|nr:1-acyl-sn-glycerol-3-phosphate acyltransferase [Steroidobacteraceae bacterium]